MDNEHLTWESDFFNKTAVYDMRRGMKLALLQLIAGSAIFYLAFKVPEIIGKPLIFVALVLLITFPMFIIDSLRNFSRNKNSVTYEIGDLGIDIRSGFKNSFYPWISIKKYEKKSNLYDANFYKFPSAEEHIQRNPIYKGLLWSMRRPRHLGIPMEAFAIVSSILNRNLDRELYVLDIAGEFVKYVTLDISPNDSQRLEKILDSKIGRV